jgi:hypothetical protein
MYGQPHAQQPFTTHPQHQFHHRMPKMRVPPEEYLYSSSAPDQHQHPRIIIDPATGQEIYCGPEEMSYSPVPIERIPNPKHWRATCQTEKGCSKFFTCSCEWGGGRGLLLMCASKTIAFSVKGHWTESTYGGKTLCSIWLKIWQNAGNIIGNKLLIGQKSVGHLV